MIAVCEVKLPNRVANPNKSDLFRPTVSEGAKS